MNTRGALKNWIIKDSIFYPLGLFNNAIRNKTVFVTWSYNSLITYIFKKTDNSNSLKDTFKILLHGTISDVVATEFNTLCLTKTGHIYYFSSCKSLKRLEFLEGVRCIAATPNGFAVIKLTKENRINLETYDDFTNSSEAGGGRKTFDISFDENNLLNSSWSGEKFCIYSIGISGDNRDFLGLVAKQSLSGSDSIFLFTINNSLFGLLRATSAEQSDFGIFLIHTVPSEIDSIRFLYEMNLILIFMSCGAMEVIFYSKLSKSLDRITHTMGADIISSTFADDCFYYSDGNKVVRCKLIYDVNNHTIVLRKDEKSLHGVVAMTWVKTMRKLICLSENNVFYRVKFTESEPKSDTFELIELNDETIKQIEVHFNKLMNLIDEPNIVHKKIKLECHKQEVMSIYSHENLYKDLVAAQIDFHKSIPALHGTTMYPFSDQIVTRNSYFATVEICIKSNRIFDTGMWRISLQLLGQTNITKIIHVNSEIIKSPFTVLLHIQKGAILLIPDIRVELTSYIKVGTDFMYISIPSKISNGSIDKLFTPTMSIMTNLEKQTINQKIMAFTKHPSIDGCQLFSTKIKTPLLMSLDELYEIFNIPNPVDNLLHSFAVYLLGERINIEYQELENIVEISSEDPGALYYTKIYFVKKLYVELYKNDSVSNKDSLQSLLKLQAELDAKCGSNTSIKAYSSSLKKIYWTIRRGDLTRVG